MPAKFTGVLNQTLHIKWMFTNAANQISYRILLYLKYNNN